MIAVEPNPRQRFSTYDEGSIGSLTVAEYEKMLRQSLRNLNAMFAQIDYFIKRGAV